MVTIERSQHLDFDRLQSFPAHEIAEARARLLGRRFQDRPLVRIAVHSASTQLTETKRSLTVRPRFSFDRKIWQGGRFACLKTWFTRSGGKLNP